MYGEYVGIFDLKTHEMTYGDLPLKAAALVKELLQLNDKNFKKCGILK
ncbi:hypothetical protein [Treponema sp. OMZ 791]